MHHVWFSKIANGVLLGHRVYTIDLLFDSERNEYIRLDQICVVQESSLHNTEQSFAKQLADIDKQQQHKRVKC